MDSNHISRCCHSVLPCYCTAYPSREDAVKERVKAHLVHTPEPQVLCKREQGSWYCVEVFASSDPMVYKVSVPQGNWCFLTPKHLPWDKSLLFSPPVPLR